MDKAAEVFPAGVGGENVRLWNFPGRPGLYESLFKAPPSLGAEGPEKFPAGRSRSLRENNFREGGGTPDRDFMGLKITRSPYIVTILMQIKIPPGEPGMASSRKKEPGAENFFIFFEKTLALSF